MDVYYQLARKLSNLDRQALARELRAMHQQTVEAVAERASDLVREGFEAGDAPSVIVAAVRSLELAGRQLADERAQLRHAEAILYALVRIHRSLTVRRADVRGAFDAGHGVDLVRGDADVKIVAQPGKYKGE